MMSPPLRLALLAVLAALLLAAPAGAQPASVDESGSARRGQAAVFAAGSAGRRMADGGLVELNSDSAASNTLPLGTTARLRNGRVAIVRVRDRLPAAGNRIIRVTPKVAQFLGIPRNGVATVEVAPLAVPQRDGSVRLGAGTGLPGRRARIVSPPR